MAGGAKTCLTCLTLTLCLAAGAAPAGTSPLDREFPLWAMTPLADTGPERVGLKLADGNLIANGGFEDWSDREMAVNPGPPGGKVFREKWLFPVAWSYRTWSGTAINRKTMRQKTHRHEVMTTFEAPDAHGGKRALNLGYPIMWFATDTFRIEPGRKYALSLWVKGRNVGKGIYQKPWPLNVYVRMFRDPKREHLTGIRAFHRTPKFAPELSTFDWRELRWQFTAPPDVAWAQLHLRPLQARGGFLLLVDDVSLRKVTREPEAWTFSPKAGFGNARRDGVTFEKDALRLSKVANLAPNGDFEIDKNKDGVPDGWSVVKRRASANVPEDKTLAVALDRRPRTGGTALKLSSSTGRIDLVSPPIQLSEPGCYTVSVYYRTPPRRSYYPYGYGLLSVRSPMDGTEYSRKLIHYAHGWVREAITFTTAGRYRSRIPPYRRNPGHEIVLSHRGQGAIWFDGLQLERGRRANRLADTGTVYADRGEAVSEIIDVGMARSGAVSWDADTPKGRLLNVATRTGFTPYYDRATWTDWSEPYKDAKGSALDLQATGAPLYLQWRAALDRDEPKIITHQTLMKALPAVAEIKGWRCVDDPTRKGVDQGFAKAEHDDGAWKLAADVKAKSLPGAKGDVWLRARFTLPKTAAGRRLYVALAPSPLLGYVTRTTVFVNGVETGHRLRGTHAPVEVSGAAAPGRENVLALRVRGAGAGALDYLAKTKIVASDASDAVARTTPALRAVRVTVAGPRDPVAGFGGVEITRFRNGEIRAPLMPFRAWKPEEFDKDPKKAALRTLAREITQGVPDEDTQVLRMRKHIYALCNYTGSPSAYNLKRPNNTPYDFLHLAVKDRLTLYCSHHWLTFTQLATGVGFVVRPVTTGHIGENYYWADNIVEYWSNKHNKWVMINTFFDNTFTRGGVPQSVADLMNAWWEDRWGEIVSRAGGDISNGFRYSAEQSMGPFGWAERPPHNRANSHGWITNVYVTDNPNHGRGVLLIRPEMEPYFVGQGYWKGRWPVTSAERELYAPINQTKLRLAFEGKLCRVAAEHNMPNFDRFEYRIGERAMQRAKTLPIEWPLTPGANTFRCRAVNRFGRPGPESVVMLRVTQPFTEPEPFLAPKAKPGKGAKR